MNLEVGNVNILGIKTGKEEEFITPKLRTTGNGSYDIVQGYGTKKYFGIEFIFENRNTLPATIEMYFSEHIERNKDGTYRYDISPKMDSVFIPTKEKVKGFVRLGQGYPTNQYDLRLQDIFLETIVVKAGGQTYKSENIHLKIYSKSQVLQVSTLLGKRIFKSLTNILIFAFLLSFLDNNNSPFWFKSMLLLGSLFPLYRIFQIWRSPFYKSLFSKND